MPFLKQINKDFYLENGQIKLTKNYLKEYLNHPKKITGGKVYSLMGADRWKTPFMTWCEMVGLYKEQSDDFVTNAGIIIEDKVFKFAKTCLNQNWESYDAAERGFDEFSGAFEGFDKNEIFGGLLDGVPMDDKTPILEIKTAAKNKWSWKKEPERGDGLFVQKQKNGFPIVKAYNGGYTKWYPNGKENGLVVPDAYKYQLGLYCYLKHQPKGIFAVAYLDDKDYISPENFNANLKTVVFQEFNQDLAQYEYQIIKPLTVWYKEFILTGVSPKITDQDKKWLAEKLGMLEYNKLKISKKPSDICK